MAADPSAGPPADPPAGPPADPLAGLLAIGDVAAAAGVTRDAVDAALKHRVLRRRSAEVAAEASVRGAWAAAWLAGARVGLADVRAGDPAALADPVMQGALRAYGALAELAGVWPHAPRQVLARLHLLAGADLVSDRTTLGTPRPVRYVAHRLATLADTLAATAAPAVVIAAVVHAEVRSLDAFPPVSAIVARAAARLVLIDRGLDPSSVIVVEAGEREQEQAQEQALADYGRGAAGVARWVVHYAGTVRAGAAETLAICEALQRG